jgi:exosome complex RNA-binding protein Csl4
LVANGHRVENIFFGDDGTYKSDAALNAAGSGSTTITRQQIVVELEPQVDLPPEPIVSPFDF